MDRSIVLYIGESLDGFIATKEDSLEWLLSVEGEGDNGFGEFYDTVDTVIMGRRTYEWIMEHEKGDFPYKGKECYVYSKTFSGKNDFVTFISEDITGLARKLKTLNGKKIWIVGGGQLIKAFEEEHLIDEYIVNIAPTILGGGIPLIAPTTVEERLKLNGVRTFGQFVEISYKKCSPCQSCMKNIL